MTPLRGARRGRDLVATSAPTSGWPATTRRDAGDLQQAQQHQVGQDLVARNLVHDAVGAQEGGSVGRLGARPDGIRHAVEGGRPENAGPVGVRVDVVAHHLALCRVRVDVSAEEGRREEQRHGPDEHDQHDATDGEARTPVEVSEKAHPDAGEEDEAAEHEGERADGRQAVGRSERTEQAAGHAEEPRPGQMRLERRPAQDRPHHDRRRAGEAEDDRASQVQARSRRRARAPTSGSVIGLRVTVSLGASSRIGANSLSWRPRSASAGRRNRHGTALILSQRGAFREGPNGSFTSFSACSQLETGNFVCHEGEIGLSRKRKERDASSGPRG